MDSVYMSRGTPNLITMWTPFGDVGTAMGTIAIQEGSHRLPAFAHLRETCADSFLFANRGVGVNIDHVLQESTAMCVCVRARACVCERVCVCVSE